MKKHSHRRYSPINLFVLIVIALFAQTGRAATTELFMSEYIEGSSFNKAIEIYNGTGATVDLQPGGYTLELYSNGSASPSQSMTLTGALADGDVYVLAHASADAAILAETDVTNSSVINFNGDDAVVLRKNGVVVDAFGQVGVDPGSQWAGGGQDDTLRRAESVCVGDSDESDAFDASTGWIVFAQNTFDGLGSHTVDCGGGPNNPVINEFVFDHTGTDTNAFIEVLGSSSTDYSAFTVLEIEGDSSGAGIIDAVLTVGTTSSTGLWIDDEDAENGTVTLLLVEGFSGSAGDDLDTDNDGVLDSTPWTQIIDDVAVSDGGSSDRTYSTVVLAPFFDGNPFGAGGASRIPNGVDTDTTGDWTRNDYDGYGFPGFVGSQQIGEAVNTPGEVNEIITVIVDPFGACNDPATYIHDIQGSGLASLDVGNIRAVEAVVVATFQGAGQIGGYFVQEEDTDSDADPLTSEGLRIFDPVNTPDMGDVVRIRGAVTEFFGLTELTNISDFAVCGSGIASASEVSLPVNSTDDFEAYEGMYVTFPQDLVISEYFNFDRYNEIVLTSQRHLTPTAEFEPGPDAIAVADAFLLDKITLDDGRSSQNSDPAIHPNGLNFDLTNLFRGGDTVANVTGVMDYAFESYRIQPTQGADYLSVNPRTAEPELVGGNFKVASFNVLNYFNGDGLGGGFPTSRGADDPDEFARQRAKIIAAMVAIDAAVFGIMEIENDGYASTSAIQDLVDGLNDATAPDTYAFVDPGVSVIGSDEIAVGLIYNQTRAVPHGSSAILDSSVDPVFNDSKNRPALAQTFRDTTTTGRFTVAVNHLKSKGSDCDDVGDPDTGDGSGNCNITRTSAANAIVNWLATDPTASGDSDFMIIGDLNSYDKEDPIDAFVAGGYTDLSYQFNGERAYSYVFDGQTGYFDYALANSDLLGEVTGVTEWHINADEVDLINYDTSFKGPNQDAIYAPDAYRSSDHDPVIVGLNLIPVADLSITKVGNPDPVIAGTVLTYTMTVTNAGPDDAFDVVVSDTLPAGLTLVSTSGCAEDPDGAPTCHLGSIAAGDSADFTITAAVAPSILGTLINTATVATSSAESNTGNNSDTSSTMVEAEADLSITKMDSSDPFISGGNQMLTYTIEVSNAGPSDATNVVVTDTLSPLATNPVTAGCLNDPNGVPECQLGTIPASGSASYTVTVSVNRSGGVMSNSVSVASDTSDPFSDNDSVEELTEVIPIMIPTLNHLGLMLLILLVGGIGWVTMRRF